MRNSKLTVFLTCGIFLLTVLPTSCTKPDYQFTSSVVPSVGGTISPSGGTFKGGSQITVVATANQNYKFIGWAGDASGNNASITLKMDSNKQLVGQFAKITYSVQTKSNPPNGGTVNPNTGTFDSGNSATFNVTASPGYRFAGWGTDASGNSNPLILQITRDLTVTANFVRQYNLSVSVDPSLGTITPNAGVYDEGTRVDISAVPAFPYAFKSWIGADDNNVNPGKVTMNTDKSVSANFILLPVRSGPTSTGNHYIASGNGVVPMTVNQNEWIEGTINCGSFPQVHAYIQGPDGKVVKDFGSIGVASFRVMVPVGGTYNVIVESNFLYGANYNVSYTIYGIK